MSRKRVEFTLTSDTGRTYRGWVGPDRNGNGVFLATYPSRGVVSVERARAIADALHDICDELEAQQGREAA